MDLAAAIQQVADLAQKAAQKTEIINLSDVEPDSSIYGIVDREGKLTKLKAAAPPRCDDLKSVDQVADYISAIATEEFTGVAAGETSGRVPVVWVCEDQVVVVLDEASCDAVPPAAHLSLTTTPEWRTLVDLSNGREMMSQRDFIQKLRIDLADVLTDSAKALIKAVRILRWSSGASTDAAVTRNRESLGSNLEAGVVAEAGDIPEEIVLSVRPFDDRAVQNRVSIKCAIETHPSEHALQLIPLPGELRRGMDLAVKSIQDRLSSECDCPVFYGRKLLNNG